MTSTFTSTRRTRCLGAVLTAIVGLSLLGGPAAAAKPARRTANESTTATPAPEPTTLIGVRAPGPTDPYTLPAMNAWQGKTNAVGVTFAKTNLPAATMLAKVVAVWEAGAVPVLTIEPLQTNAGIVAGEADWRLDTWSALLQPWLAGPDLVAGTADDRRLFVRLAHEANGSWYPWSPCSATGGSPADYRAMWRYVHGRFDVGDAHMQWIFSMNQTDTSSACRPEVLYPGDKYVDWMGFDGYSRSKGKSPAQELAPMATRLRAIAPNKPLSINEAGASAVVTTDKSQWIRDYYAWVHANDVRMVSYFNTESTRDWTVFGLVSGDETFTHGLVTYRAWSAYRQAIAPAWALGSDTANPRLITDAQFTGQ